MDDAERDELLIRVDERTKAIAIRLEKGDECMKDHEKRLTTIEDVHKADDTKGGLLSRLSSGTASFILVLCAVSALLIDLLWRR